MTINDSKSRRASKFNHRRGWQGFAVSNGVSRAPYLLFAGFIAAAMVYVISDKQSYRMDEPVSGEIPTALPAIVDKNPVNPYEAQVEEYFEAEPLFQAKEPAYDQGAIVDRAVEAVNEAQNTEENDSISSAETLVKVDEGITSPKIITQNIEQAIAQKDAALFETSGQQLLNTIEQGTPCPACVSRIKELLENEQSSISLRIIAAKILSSLGTSDAVDTLLSTALNTQIALSNEKNIEESGALQQLSYEILSSLANSPDPDQTIQSVVEFLAHTSPDDFSVLSSQAGADFYAMIHEQLVGTFRAYPDREALMEKMVAAYFQGASETGKQNLLNLNLSEFYASLAITANKAEHPAERDLMLSHIYDIGPPDEFVNAMLLVTENIDITMDQYTEQTELWALKHEGRYDVEDFSTLLHNSESSKNLKHLAISVLGVQQDTEMVIDMLEVSLLQENDPELLNRMQVILLIRKQEQLSEQTAN